MVSKSEVTEELERAAPSAQTGVAREVGLSAVLQAVLQRDPTVRIGPYVVQGRLGAGGMGAVYRAWDPRLERTIALKLLLDAGGDASRLQDEARALAKLEHPNVVSVYDVGDDEQGTYVAMELVDGPTLRTWLETHADASVGRIVQTFVQAGRGLAAAHEVGVVHRDFKPDNAIVGSDGRVRVVDFGIAHIRGDDDRHPTAGTPSFMAPEQRRGEEATPQADQYAFCLALRRALEPSRLEDLSREARAAVERGLQDDPDARWPSMAPLLDALAPRAPRRRRWLVAGLGMLGVFGVAALASRDATPSCPAPRSDAESIWDDARRNAMQARFTEHDVPGAATFSRRVDEMVDTWSEHRQSACGLLHADEPGLVATGRGRLSCLDLVSEGLDALLTDLATREADTLERAGLALDAIARPEDCEAGRDTLVGSLPDPDLLRRVQAGSVARQLYDYDSALRYLEPAYDEALAADMPRLATTAALTLSYQDNDEDALQRKWAERALESAERSGDIDLMVRAWLRNSYVELRSTPEGPWEERLGHALRLASGATLHHATAGALAEARANQAVEHGDHRTALRYFDASVTAHTAAERRGSAASIYCLRAESYAALGEMEPALADLDTCLSQLAEHLGPEHPTLLIRLGIGMRLSMVANDLERTIELADRAIVVGRRGKHRARTRIAPYLYAAGANTELSNVDRALEYLRDGLEVAKTLDSTDAEASMHGQYGATLSEHGDCAAALPHFDAALDLSKYQSDSSLTRGITQLNRAECKAKLGDGDGAMLDVDRAWEVLQLPETSTLRLSQVRFDGQISMYAGRLDRAVEKLAEVEARADAVQMPPAELAYALYLRARVEAQRGNHKIARDYVARARETYEGHTAAAVARVREFEAWAAAYANTPPAVSSDPR